MHLRSCLERDVFSCSLAMQESCRRRAQVARARARSIPPEMHAVRLQMAGFAAVFVLFLACGLAFQPLTSSNAMLSLFQALYYISSFFAQFVNATTFLLVSCPCTWLQIHIPSGLEKPQNCIVRLPVGILKAHAVSLCHCCCHIGHSCELSVLDQ